MAFNPHRAFHTPPPLASGGGMFYLLFADDAARAALFGGALAELTDPENWQQVEPSNITPEEAAEYFAAALYAAWGTPMLIGSLLPYVTAAPPAGVLPCAGGTYARADYPRLYAALAPAFIVDADTFTVPDLRGAAPFGAGGGAVSAIGQVGGAATVTLTEAQIPPHTHFYYPPTINLDLETPGVPDMQGAGLSLGAQTGSAGGGQAHENMPPFVGVHWGIVHG